MVEKKIIILFIIFVLLLAYFLIFEKKKPEVEQKNRILNFVLSDVRKFELENLSVVRDEKNNKWNITKPLYIEASNREVEQYIQELKDLNYDRIVSTNISDKKEFGLDKPLKYLRIWCPDEKLLKVGSKNIDGSKFYLSIEGENKIYLIDSIKQNLFEKTDYDMREKMVFKIDASKVIKFNIYFDNKNYVAILTGTTNKIWRLQKPVKKEINTEEVNSILYNIETLRVSKFIDTKLDEITAGLKPAKIKLELWTDNNENHQIFIGNKVKDGYYISYQDKQYFIDEWFINSILKEALQKFLKKEKTEEVKTNA